MACFFTRPSCETDRMNSSDIDALSTADAAFRAGLMGVHCGNTDNGYGGSLTDEAIIRLSLACPNLKDVTFEAATGLGDEALLALVNKCPNIKSIRITGHDKRTGRITSAALKTIQQNKKVGFELVHLDLMDQGVDGKACKALSNARKSLAVLEGRTDGDGIAAQMVASIAGEGDATTWFGGKMVGDDFGDSGGYGYVLPQVLRHSAFIP